MTDREFNMQEMKKLQEIFTPTELTNLTNLSRKTLWRITHEGNITMTTKKAMLDLCDTFKITSYSPGRPLKIKKTKNVKYDFDDIEQVREYNRTHPISEEFLLGLIYVLNNRNCGRNINLRTDGCYEK